MILYVIIKTEKNPKRIFKTRRYHRVHLKQVRRTIYLRERNKSRFLAAEEIPKPLIKRVDGFKLLIRKFASCAPHGAGRNAPVVLLRGKHSPEEHTTGKVTGNSDGVRAEARAEKGAAIGVGGGYRSRNICMEISCGGETLPVIFLPATGNFGSIHSSRISLGKESIS